MEGPLLVSIIMPVYNSERHLAEAIDSIVAQTYQNWELIAVNDGSTDASSNTLAKYEYMDSRIRVITFKENKGVASARNTGIAAANGRYLMFLDSDDLWDANKIEVQLSFMELHNCPFSFTSYRLINEDGTYLQQTVPAPETISYQKVLYQTAIWTCTVCLDLSIIEKPSMPLLNGAEDTSTWVNLLKGIECAYGINQVLASYRQVPSSLSHNLKSRLERMWVMYRTVEHFSLFYSMVLYLKWFVYVLQKRKKSKGDFK